MTNTQPAFPRDFLWGAATASYQIEGATNEDGRSESIWDRFAATPGKVRNGESGAIATDHYHRYREDIGLIRELGLSAYRFSIAWPRVLPAGTGAVNSAGLDFYDRLVDELLSIGVRPFVTLYHWDMPQALEDRGGWPNRDTVDAYLEYATAVVQRLGDRVKDWITHNEPWVAAWLGYGFGVHAPGRTDRQDALAAAHHLLLSHGRAVEMIRAESPGSQVGITLNLNHVYPASDSEADREAALQSDGFGNRWFLDPVFRGRYPDDVVRHMGGDLSFVRPGDMETIAAEIDFLGINNYSRALVQAGPEGRPTHLRPEGTYTDMDWEVYPQGLHDLLVRVHRDYAPSTIYVTENGAAFTDVLDHERRVLDPERQEYIGAHLDAVARAAAEGVPMGGYFVWSLLDNFEWAYGYSKRFGIIYVDYPTQDRIPKGSYYWYRDFIARQRAQVGEAA